MREKWKGKRPVGHPRKIASSKEMVVGGHRPRQHRGPLGERCSSLLLRNALFESFLPPTLRFRTIFPFKLRYIWNLMEFYTFLGFIWISFFLSNEKKMEQSKPGTIFCSVKMSMCSSRRWENHLWSYFLLQNELFGICKSLSKVHLFSNSQSAFFFLHICQRNVMNFNSEEKRERNVHAWYCCERY